MKVDKYIISYKGEAVVYASSFEEAKEKYENGDIVSEDVKTKYIERVYFAKERWRVNGEENKEAE